MAEFTPMVRLATLLQADDPEDLVQDAFYRLLGRWNKLSDPAKAAAYLTAMVVNLTRTRHRHLSMARRLAPRPDPAGPGTEESVLLRSEHAAVIEALRNLTPRHREALVLRYWLDLSEKQMADAMKTSLGTVKSHVSRGLVALRTALESGESL